MKLLLLCLPSTVPSHKAYYVSFTQDLLQNLQEFPVNMKSNDTLHNADNSGTTDISRRKFLATSAVGIAGLGAVGSAAAAPDKHTLVIGGTGSKSNYSFTVGRNLEKSTADGATIDGDATITNNSAHGLVGSGKDAYTFDGELVAFNFDFWNPINVLLDGEPAHVGIDPITSSK